MAEEQKSNLPMVTQLGNGQSRTYSQTWCRKQLPSVFWMWQPGLQMRAGQGLGHCEGFGVTLQQPGRWWWWGCGQSPRSIQSKKVPKGCLPRYFKSRKGHINSFHLSGAKAWGSSEETGLCFHQWKEREGLLFDWRSFSCFAHVDHEGHTLWLDHHSIWGWLS